MSRSGQGTAVRAAPRLAALGLAVAALFASGCAHCQRMAMRCGLREPRGLPTLSAPCELEDQPCGAGLPPAVGCAETPAAPPAPAALPHPAGPLGTPGLPPAIPTGSHNSHLNDSKEDIPLPPLDDDGSTLPSLSEDTLSEPSDSEETFFKTSSEAAPPLVQLLQIEEIADDEEENATDEDKPLPLIEPAGALLPAPIEAMLAVSRAALCSEVRGYNQFVEADATVHCGEPVLIYAALDGTSSEFVGGAYWTHTTSTLQIVSDGQVIVEQDLGEVEDEAASPRTKFFVTHKLLVPEGLAAGEYNFRLVVRDTQSEQIAIHDIPVTLATETATEDE